MATSIRPALTVIPATWDCNARRAAAESPPNSGTYFNHAQRPSPDDREEQWLVVKLPDAVGADPLLRVGFAQKGR